MTDKMIFVSMVGNMVAASETQDVAEAQAMEMVFASVKSHISDAYERGDKRQSISIRTVHVELR